MFPGNTSPSVLEPCSPQSPQPFALNVLCPPTTEVSGDGRRTAKQDGCICGHVHGHAYVEHSQYVCMYVFLYIGIYVFFPYSRVLMYV